MQSRTTMKMLRAGAMVFVFSCASLLFTMNGLSPLNALEGEVVNTGSVVPEVDTVLEPTITSQSQPDASVAGSDVTANTPLTGDEILRRIDDNVTSENRRATTTMIVHGRRGSRTMEAQTWVQGTRKSFTEYLSPPREKGTKMLKLKDQMWIFSPSTDRTIRIAGHMLRRSMMGSDVSYEDTMEDPELSVLYDAELVGEEECENRRCYVVELTAKEGADLAYYQRKVWVDTERFLPLREDRFARSGKLLKTFLIKEVFQLAERWYPKRMTFKDVLKQGKGTEYIIDTIEFNVEIPEHVFSKASLRR